MWGPIKTVCRLLVQPQATVGKAEIQSHFITKILKGTETGNRRHPKARDENVWHEAK
jgi:hypothetical protein